MKKILLPIIAIMLSLLMLFACDKKGTNYRVAFDYAAGQGKVELVTQGLDLSAIPENTELEFKVDAIEGFIIKSVTVNGNKQSLKDGKFKVTLTENITIKVEFEEVEGDPCASGHSWGEGKVTTEPTCEGKGVRTFTCSRCNATKTEEIAALGHDFSQWQQIKAPSCLEKGEEKRTCSRCNKFETQEVAALGHDFVDGVCSRCGEKEQGQGGDAEEQSLVFVHEGLEAGTYLLHAWNEAGFTDTVALTLQDGKLVGKIAKDAEKGIVALLKEGETTLGEDWINVLKQSEEIVLGSGELSFSWAGENPQNQGFALTIGNQIIPLELNAGQTEFVEYMAKGVETQGGEVLAKDLSNAASWTPKVLDPNSSVKASMEDGKIMLEAGTFDFYLKLIEGNDELAIVEPQQPVEDVTVVFTHDGLLEGAYLLHAWNNNGLEADVELALAEGKLSGKVSPYATNGIVVLLKEGETTLGDEWANVEKQSKEIEFKEGEMAFLWSDEEEGGDDPQPGEAKFSVLVGEQEIELELNEAQTEFVEWMALDIEVTGGVVQAKDVKNDAVWTPKTVTASPDELLSEELVLAAGRYSFYLKLIENADELYIAGALPVEDIDVVFTHDELAEGTYKLHAWNGSGLEVDVDLSLVAGKLEGKVSPEAEKGIVVLLKDGESEYGEEWANVEKQSQEIDLIGGQDLPFLWEGEGEPTGEGFAILVGTQVVELELNEGQTEFTEYMALNVEITDEGVVFGKNLATNDVWAIKILSEGSSANAVFMVEDEEILLSPGFYDFYLKLINEADEVAILDHLTPVPTVYVAWYDKEETSGLNENIISDLDDALYDAFDDFIVLLESFAGSVAESGALINEDGRMQVAIGWGKNFKTTGGVDYSERQDGIKMGEAEGRYVYLLDGEDENALAVYNFLLTYEYVYTAPTFAIVVDDEEPVALTHNETPLDPEFDEWFIEGLLLDDVAQIQVKNLKTNVVWTVENVAAGSDADLDVEDGVMTLPAGLWNVYFKFKFGEDQVYAARQGGGEPIHAGYALLVGEQLVELTQNPEAENEYMALGVEVAEAGEIQAVDHGTEAQWFIVSLDDASTSMASQDPENHKITVSPGKFNFYLKLVNEADELYIEEWSESTGPQVEDMEVVFTHADLEEGTYLVWGWADQVDGKVFEAELRGAKIYATVDDNMDHFIVALLKDGFDQLGDEWANVEKQSENIEMLESDEMSFLWKGESEGGEDPEPLAALYLVPSEEWLSYDAWFAAYFFGGKEGNHWVEIVKINENYVCPLDEETEGYTMVIFVRMRPESADGYSNENDGLNWTNMWSQTADLEIGALDTYTIDGWDAGEWS